MVTNAPGTIETFAASGANETALVWQAETDPVPDGRDAADDPAIWVNPQDPGASLIFGTNKKGDRGLLVYDLAGREVGAYDGGAMNNVDLRSDVRVGDRSLVLVVASAVDRRELTVLEFEPSTGGLRRLPNGVVEIGIRGSGLCLWRPPDGRVYAMATAGNGRVEQWALVNAGGAFEPSFVREFTLSSRVEGCVTDDETGELFLAEETVGIWRGSADPDAQRDLELIDQVGGSTGLVADVEGIAIARYKDGRRYLVVSSQGSDRFIVYRLDGGRDIEAVGQLRVQDPNGDDDVDHTDGIEVVVGDFDRDGLGGGLMVVQDDDNKQPRGEKANQNFKLIGWEKVGALLSSD